MKASINRELYRVRSSLYNCRKCGLCGNKTSATVPYVCPVRKQTAGFEHFYSRGKMVIAQGILEGKIVPSRELAEIIYTCTLCGNCRTQCATIDLATKSPLVDPPEVVEAMRADLMREHPDWIKQEYTIMLNGVLQYGNPWGLPRTAKERWTKGLSLKDAKGGSAEVLLYMG